MCQRDSSSDSTGSEHHGATAIAVLDVTGGIVPPVCSLPGVGRLA